MSIKKAKLPILDLNFLLEKSDIELTDLLFIFNTLTGGSYVYSWKRGKYGVLTNGFTRETFRINKDVFEKIQNFIDSNKK